MLSSRPVSPLQHPRMGAVRVDADKNEILSTGYSMEDRPADPGTTHAEQCCFIKVAEKQNLPEERIGEILPKNSVLYTTMELCNKRLSGNKTCVERILGLNGPIKVVYVGIQEPETFVGVNVGRKRLEDAGVVVTFVEGLQGRILEVSIPQGMEIPVNDGQRLNVTQAPKATFCSQTEPVVITQPATLLIDSVI